MNQIDAAKIASVYSGKPGCMCGCRGKYHYASAFLAAERKKQGLITDDEVSDRSVKIIVGKLNKNPKTKIEDGIASLHLENRTLVAYFADGTY